jgi:hypothetical protein
MEFKTKAALAEWANDQTMAEIAAYYDGLPGVKPAKKFESREVAVTRIWAVLSPEPAADKPQVARKPKAARKKATSGRKQPKTSKPRKASKAGATVRDEAVKLLSRAGGVTLPELMKAFKWQAHSVRALFRFFNRSTATRSSRRRSPAFGRPGLVIAARLVNGRGRSLHFPRCTLVNSSIESGH